MSEVDEVSERTKSDEAPAISAGTVVGQFGVPVGKYEKEFARRDDPHFWQNVAESGSSALHRGQFIDYSHLYLIR